MLNTIFVEDERAQHACASEDLRRDSDAFQYAVDHWARPHLGRTGLALLTSVVPFLGLWVSMFYALSVSYLLVLAISVLAAGFLLRTYILFHDCAHGSLLPWRRANAWLGSVLALIVFTPFARWRYEHAGHHATAGNLDRRGLGDVPTLTLAEYQAKGWLGRLGYRLFRNPLIMFGLGPIFAMLLEPRWAPRTARSVVQRSTWRTNVAIALMVAGMCWLVGWRDFVYVEAPLVFLAGGAGIWLFYVQHQFAETYWEHTPEWTYPDAALRGSSYLRLPKILQFFTGNIGLHHVHHLNPKVPNYNLQRMSDFVPALRHVPRVSLWEGLRAVRFKLWDEQSERLLTWGDVRRARVAVIGGAGGGI
jgi:omega-6 fatty acid desaturase (delta-12 desaturase)